MTKIVSWLVRLAGMGPARRLSAMVHDPAAAQVRVLDRLVSSNRDTEFGREHGFGSIRTLDDWRKAVPVARWEDLRPRIERVMRGERNVLTAEDPVMFARTSGTTGTPKYIPITPSCLALEHREQSRSWFGFATADHPRMFSGRVVGLASPAIEGRAPCGLPFGSTTGHIYQSMPGMVRSTYVLPYETFEIEDYEARYHAILALALGVDITYLSTANPSTILQIVERADKNAEALIRDIHDGTLPHGLRVERAARAKVVARLKRDPARARELARMRERRGGRLLPRDYWPGLALIGCWKGGTVAPHVERFPEWFDPDGDRPVAVRDLGWLASEVRGSVPIRDDGCAGIPVFGSVLLEFVPVDDVEDAPDSPHLWEFLGPDDVQVGERYYVIITTAAGLYRYDINDVVEVCGRFERTPLIVFVRKGCGVANITGEKVTVDQVIAALESASAAVGVAIDRFRAEADHAAACYVFKVELADGLAEDARSRLLDAIERGLRSLNIEYEAKRKSLRLNAPTLLVMRAGWFEARLRRQPHKTRTFQAKATLLAPDRDDTDREFVVAKAQLESPG